MCCSAEWERLHRRYSAYPEGVRPTGAGFGGKARLQVDEAEFGIVQAKHANGLRMVRPEGELDMTSAPQLRKFVERLWADGVTDVFIDLSRTSFVDSRGLGVLVELEKGARLRNLTLQMGGASDSLMRLFEISGVASILQLVPVPVYEPPAGVA